MSGSLVPFPSADKTLILDSWPIMEWLKAREPTATYFDSLIDSARAGTVRLLMSTINFGEVYYSCWNWWDEARAEQLAAVVKALPVEMIHPTADDAFLAARIKGYYKGAYGDAFAAVLGIEFGAPVLSGDPDFLRFREGGLVVVEWIGR